MLIIGGRREISKDSRELREILIWSREWIRSSDYRTREK